MNIEISNLTKTIEGQKVINQFNLLISEGSIHGILGSNGAGKTTLLKLLAGLLKEEKGQVNFDGCSIYDNSALKQKVIFVPDIPYFFRGASLQGQRKFYERVYQSFDGKRFEQLCDMFQLDVKQPISSFSKGMQRQALFILVLSIKADILLLDEPFDGLDPIIRQKIKNLLIQEVSERSVTLVISSHNLREVEDLCDAVTILHYGQKIYSSALDTMKTNICKLQIAFRSAPPKALFDQLQIYKQTKTGRVYTLLIRKDNSIEQIITQFNPLMYDILPLTLEEIFSYEMGERGYEIHNIILES